MKAQLCGDEQGRAATAAACLSRHVTNSRCLSTYVYSLARP